MHPEKRDSTLLFFLHGGSVLIAATALLCQAACGADESTSLAPAQVSLTGSAQTAGGCNSLATAPYFPDASDSCCASDLSYNAQHVDPVSQTCRPRLCLPGGSRAWVTTSRVQDDTTGRFVCADSPDVLAFRGCGSGSSTYDWSCFIKAPPPPVCCKRLDDWEYKCSEENCIEPPPPPPPPGPRLPPPPPRSVSTSVCIPGCFSTDLLGNKTPKCCGTLITGGAPRPYRTAFLPRDSAWITPTNADPPGCDLPYDDVDFGAKNADVGSEAGPDFDCLTTEATGTAVCKLNAEFQTMIAGAEKVFAADIVAKQRAFVPNPRGRPAPAKSPDEVLTDPLPCGGVGTAPAALLGDGIDVAQGAMVRLYGCGPMTGGALPIEVGLRYESGAYHEQEGLKCAGSQVVRSGLVDRSGFRSANLSNGWTVSFSRRIFETSNGLDLYAENHRVYRFIAVESKNRKPEDAADDEVFVQRGIDGDALSSYDAATIRSSNNTYELQYTNGTRDIFTRRTGALAEQRDRWGNRIVISYFTTTDAQGSRLAKRLTRFAPDPKEGFKELDYIDMYSQWAWGDWQGATNVAERLFRLATVTDTQGNKVLSFEYDGAFRLAKLQQWLRRDNASVESFTYEPSGMMTGIEDSFGNKVSVRYEDAPAISWAELPSDITRLVAGIQSRFAYRKLAEQSSATTPHDGISNIALTYGDFGAATVKATLGTGLTQLFGQRYKTLLRSDGAANAAATHQFSADGLSTRRDLQVEKTWVPGVETSGPFQLQRRDLGTGLLAAQCVDGREGHSESCVRYVYRTLSGQGVILDDHILPSRVCRNEGIVSSCKVFDYTSEAAKSCRIADKLSDKTVGAPGFGEVVWEATIDPATCALASMKAPGNAPNEETTTTFSYSVSGENTGLLTKVSYTPAGRADLAFKYSDGRLVETSAGGVVQSSIARENLGRPTQVINAEGLVEKLEYGDRLDGRAVKVVRGQGNDLLEREFTWDDHGNLVTVRQKMGEGGNRIDESADRKLAALGGGYIYKTQTLGKGSSNAKLVVNESLTVEEGGVRSTFMFNGKSLAQNILRGNGEPSLEQFLPGIATPSVTKYNSEGLAVEHQPIIGGKTTRAYSYSRPTTTTFTSAGAKALEFGVSAYFGYSAIPKQIRSARGCEENLDFTPAGLVTKKQMRTRCPDGPVIAETEYTYDSWGRTVKEVVTDTASRSESISTAQWDDLGRLVQRCVYPQNPAKGQCLKMRYSQGGLVSQVEQPGGQITAYTYDKLGHLLATTDAAANVANFRYRADGLLLEQVWNQQVVSYAYDEFGNKTQESDANASGGMARFKRWTYDADGQVVAFADLDGRERTFTYDANTGRLATATAGGTTCRLGDMQFSVGPLDACSQGDVESPSAGITTFTYFDDGLTKDVILRVRDVCSDNAACEGSVCEIGMGGQLGLCAVRTTKTEFTYDDLRMLASRRTDAMVLEWSRSFANGKINSLDLRHILPGLSETVTYQFDDLGRTTTLKALGYSIQYGYDERFGLLNSVRGGARGTDYSYDAAGRIKALEHFTPLGPRHRLLRFEIPDDGRDANGNILKVLETWRDEDPLAHSFGYDNLNRLIRVSQPALPGRTGSADGCDAVTDPDVPVAVPMLDPNLGWGATTIRALSMDIGFDVRGNTLSGPAGPLAFGMNDRIATPGYRYDGNGNLVQSPDRLPSASNNMPCPPPDMPPPPSTPPDMPPPPPPGPVTPPPKEEPSRRLSCSTSFGAHDSSGGNLVLALLCLAILSRLTRRR